METCFVARDNSGVLTVKLGRETSLVAYQGPVSRKSRKLFGPVKPFLMICISKRKQCIGIKLCMEVNFIRIKIVWKEQLCKHKA